MDTRSRTARSIEGTIGDRLANLTPFPVDLHQIHTAHAELAKYGVSLAANQVQMNLLHRKIETNGVLETARRLGITLIAYVPLRSGMLTGKLHADPTLVGKLPRQRRLLTGISHKSLRRTTPLIDGLRSVATAHQATVSQVALAWLITYYSDTVVATQGASKPHHAEEAAGAMKIGLSDEETRRLADLST